MEYQDDGIYLNDLLNEENVKRNNIILGYNNDKRHYSRPIMPKSVIDVCMFCDDPNYHYFDQSHDRYCSVCHSKIFIDWN